MKATLTAIIISFACATVVAVADEGNTNNLWRLLASSDIVALGELRVDAVKGTDEYVVLEFTPMRVLKASVPTGRTLKVRFFDREETHAVAAQHLNRFAKKPVLVVLVQVDEHADEALYFAGELNESVREPDPAVERAIERELKLQERIAREFTPDIDLHNYKNVKGLLASIKDADSQQTAFTKLEGLGKEGVPAIISQMDDFRELPSSAISLRNQSGHWEGIRHYGPDKVVDALAGILNQVTHHSYRFIYNGGSNRERRACINAWRVHLHHTQDGHNKRVDATRLPSENRDRNDE